MSNSNSLLKVKELEKEYNNVLKQYEDAYIELIEEYPCENQIKQNKQQSLESLSDRSFWGTSGLKESSVNSQKDCENMCLSQSTCTGATYNASKRYCWTRAGSGLLTVTTGNTALISTNLKNIITLQKLNTKLQELNKKIANEINKSYDNNLENKINKERIELKKTHDMLVKQNSKLEKSILEYEKLNGVGIEKNLYADQQNSILRLLTIIALILVIITIIKQSGSNGLNSNMLFWLIVVVFLILSTFSLNSPQGFLIWFIVIMLVIIINFSG